MRVNTALLLRSGMKCTTALNGWSIPFADGEIAAIAFTQNLILVTRNVDDFSMYAQLQVEDWFRADGILHSRR